MLIITGSDDNYAPGVMVLIASAAFHNPGARFAVLDMGIAPENRHRIDQLGVRLGVDVRRFEIDAATFGDLPILRGHLTRSTYLRLLIPDLLPQEDRVIYLDCDMVVMGSLEALDQVPLGDAVIAAVPDPCPYMEDVAATGLTPGTYVNAGLLVLNLPVWRRENVAGQCVALLSDAAHPLLAEDQSAINIVARGRVVFLGPEYNVYSEPKTYQRLEDLPMTPVIVHYIVNNKPWNFPTTFGRIWLFHRDRIADLMPPQRKMSLRRRLSIWNRSRKMMIGLVSGNRRYRLRRQLADLMNGRITDDYLSRVARS